MRCAGLLAAGVRPALLRHLRRPRRRGSRDVGEAHGRLELAKGLRSHLSEDHVAEWGESMARMIVRAATPRPRRAVGPNSHTDSHARRNDGGDFLRAIVARNEVMMGCQTPRRLYWAVRMRPAAFLSPSEPSSSMIVQHRLGRDQEPRPLV